MWTKRILLWLPLAILLVLAQSFFWVPTYDQQAAGNPNRLKRFIIGSIGDAEILNPILSADKASSDIHGLVFDGLLDDDDQLRLRPRLASKWVQYEEAYLTLNPKYRFTGTKSLDEAGDVILSRLKKNASWSANIKSVELVPEQKIKRSLSIPKLNEQGQPVMEGGRPQMRSVEYTLHHPPRLKFTLSEIDQDFFKPIEKLLGTDYFNNLPFEKIIRAGDPKDQGHLKPKYATLLLIKEHNPVIVFDLRQDVRFHDGHLFDSGDVLFTYQAIMNEKNLSPRRSDYEPVKTAEVLGPYKIKFTYKRLFSPAISAWAMGMLPEHLLNDDALKKEAEGKGITGEKLKAFSVRDSDFNRHPIGTGPFRFKEWQSDELIRLASNQDYWEGPPEYEEHITRIIPDPLTQELEFYAGAVDTYGVQPYQVERLKGHPKYSSLSTAGFNYSFIGYNTRKPMFANPEVRRAMGMALDIEKIIQYVMYQQGERVTGPYPKITDWYDPDVKPLPYDPEGALQILTRLGWKPNAEGWLEKEGKMFEFNLITNNGNPSRKAILTVVQNQWRKIGIKCNTQLFEWAVFLKDFVNTLKFDAVVLGWSMSSDPDLFQLWHSSQAGPQQLNFVGFKNDEADRLIVRIRQEYDRDRQIEMAHRLHQVIAKEQPYTFLYVGKSTLLLDKKIAIVDKQPDGTETYSKITPVKGGRIYYHFNRWRKLSQVPELSPAG